jgi:large subunit ribosomal protein L29
MNVAEIRSMNDDALLDAIEDQRAALFNLRFQRAAGQLEDTNLIRYAKRDLARLLTVQHERELAAQVAEEESNE